MTETAVLAMSWEVLPREEAGYSGPSGSTLEILEQRFSELISAPEATQGLENTSAFEAPQPHSLSTMLVAKLDAVGMEFKNNMERAHATFDSAPQDISLVDALKAQYEMAVVTLQIDVVGKGVQKSVQNVETFLKMQ